MSRVCLLLLITSLLTPVVSLAQPGAQPAQQITDLDELLDSVRSEQRQQRERNKLREQRFLADKSSQQALLAQARKALESSKKDNQPLVAVTQTNEESIRQLEQDLEEVVRDMGGLSNTFSEFAGDFATVLQESMISMQLPERAQELRKLAAIRRQPSIGEIESLWLLLQEEMTEAGKIARFETSVVTVDGTSSQQSVLRIGPFSAFSEGNFLRYIPETKELLVLSRQPAARFRAAAASFGSEPNSVNPVTVDPTRGSLLGMLSYTPSWRERLDQGGAIGLIIIALGAFGLLLAGWRGLYLGLVFLRMRAQLNNLETPRTTNPLGRVLLAVQGVDLAQEELVQLVLDEAVLVEMPALERGNGVIKLLAATSPLLGLLGTVTGMIITFQSISLFGTGDPKLMAGGISQALITTVLGLVVAIPLLFSHSIIAYLSRSMIQRLDEQCAGVLARNAEQVEKNQ